MDASADKLQMTMNAIVRIDVLKETMIPLRWYFAGESYIILIYDSQIIEAVLMNNTVPSKTINFTMR